MTAWSGYLDWARANLADPGRLRRLAEHLELGQLDPAAALAELDPADADVVVRSAWAALLTYAESLAAIAAAPTSPIPQSHRDKRST